ncbi:PREDICTED: LOC110755644, partial [Prunus dulcis]
VKLVPKVLDRRPLSNPPIFRAQKPKEFQLERLEVSAIFEASDATFGDSGHRFRRSRYETSSTLRVLSVYISGLDRFWSFGSQSKYPYRAEGLAMISSSSGHFLAVVRDQKLFPLLV